ncbi:MULTISPECIES: hypothetical protein [Pseudoalteromonas]|uniref:Uncharacterized protein n=1 Tax=Pseudoalteromonas amylolytica TaxID=1859457 RepID=A0A1S1MQ16_9GAMM|nr:MULTISPECIES: hypothetical protein [Pseudoalteromonas]OHU86682.1 hypothetical protein BFC16_14345 [Pseudoalteromonas sp. JW3]OHU88794.1 hypothetical protein BET10_18410 [Pseudoalteromonas amylolytica]
MEDIGKVKLYLLRAMYIFIFVGLGLSNTPEAISEMGVSTDSYTVINAMLMGFMLMSLLGAFYPLKMLPILMFELLWKILWLALFALPMYLNAGLDEYAIGVAFACIIGVVLTPIVLPWRYIINTYFN